MTLFLSIFATVFLAEMGDKTQFFLIAMATKFKLRDIVIGTLLSIAALNVLAIAVGSALAEVIPTNIIKFAAAAAFLLFAYTGFCFSKADGENHEVSGRSKKGFAAIAAVFGLFFLAELGDKTQLAAVSFASSYGLAKALTVFLACSLGLACADAIGVAVGYISGKKLPARVLSAIANTIFLVFGIYTVFDAVKLTTGNFARAAICAVAALMLFGSLCIVTNIIKSSIKKSPPASDKPVGKND